MITRPSSFVIQVSSLNDRALPGEREKFSNNSKFSLPQAGNHSPLLCGDVEPYVGNLARQ